MEKLKTIYLQFRRRRILFFIAFMGSTLAGLILVDLRQEMIDTAITADIGRFRGFGIKFLWILGGISGCGYSRSVFVAFSDLLRRNSVKASYFCLVSEKLSFRKRTGAGRTMCLR